MDDTDNNNNLILIKPKFLPTPKPKLNNNNNSSKSPNCNSAKAVTKFQPAKAKGPSSSQLSVPSKSVETVSSALAKSATSPEPGLANADSGATGTYLRLEDIKVLRDLKVSLPAHQITVAVAERTLIRSTHHGYLDVPGHGPMLALIFVDLYSQSPN